VTVNADSERLAELFARPVQIFDLDGTLVDTLVDLTVALNMALYDHRLPPVSRDLVRASLHGGFEASVRAALEAADAHDDRFDPLLASYQHRYRAVSGKLARVYRGVPRKLAELRRHGARLAICSNKTEAEARRLLELMGIAGFFEAVVGADTCGTRKPDPEPLVKAIDLLGGNRGHALFTGDSHVDVACAHAAGVDCAFFGGGYGDPQATVSARFDAWDQLPVHG
jgi:phosphoglycolate phosphatase